MIKIQKKNTIMDPKKIQTSNIGKCSNNRERSLQEKYIQYMLLLHFFAIILFVKGINEYVQYEKGNHPFIRKQIS